MIAKSIVESGAMPTLVISLMLALLSVPPLTDAQRAQLATAADRSAVLDEGALYSLVAHVMEWPADDEAGAVVPDYQALLTAPDKHRGDLFLIEGRFARSRRFGLARPGPWGEALTEWVLLVREDPQEVAVVYFVDPEGKMDADPPRVGRPIRAAARFYKLWGDRDAEGNPATYLTFVGRSATRVGSDSSASGGADGSSSLSRALWIGPLVVVALAGYILLRYTLRPRIDRAVSSRLHGKAPETARDGVRMAAEADDLRNLPASDLPSDPAEAMEELARRREDTQA